MWGGPSGHPSPGSVLAPIDLGVLTTLSGICWSSLENAVCGWLSLGMAAAAEAVHGKDLRRPEPGQGQGQWECPLRPRPGLFKKKKNVGRTYKEAWKMEGTETKRDGVVFSERKEGKIFAW